MPAPATRSRSGLERLDRIWRRHGRTIWIAHSIWALGTGVVVLWLAQERYDFVYWVVGFLVLTWASTLFFGRPRSIDGDDDLSARFGRGLASYLTRVLYQETLFFLLPFYAYSAVVPSWNVVFVALLALLAILACLDLVFDRWLRESPVFSLVFFTSVAFGALNLLLPTLFSIAPDIATPAAALLALASAAPLALGRRSRERGAWLRLGAAGLAILGVALWLPQLVPPTPLRLQEVAFAADIDRSSLEPIGAIGDGAASESLDGQLVVLARVFAPANVPARVSLDWYRDGALVRSSREVEIVAHEGGFRFWDALRPDGGAVAPGRYRIVLRTTDERVFGAAAVRVR